MAEEPAKPIPTAMCMRGTLKSISVCAIRRRCGKRRRQQVLDRVGLRPGMSCLDVGSGPGAVMRLMADRVGPEGRVTGIEIDGAARRPGARRPPRAKAAPQFEQIEADCSSSKTVPGAPFDLTFCRLFLMHMQDPVAVLEKMPSWTKPGGVVAAQEFDFGAIAVEPLCPAMAEFNRLFEGVFRAHGRNLRAGRQLPAQFEAAGLGVPDGTLAEAKFLPLKDMATMLIGVYQGLFAAGRRARHRRPGPRRSRSRPTWPRPVRMGAITALRRF